MVKSKRDAAMEFLMTQVKIIGNKDFEFPVDGLKNAIPDSHFGIYPFYIEKGKCSFS